MHTIVLEIIYSLEIDLDIAQTFCHAVQSKTVVQVRFFNKRAVVFILIILFYSLKVARTKMYIYFHGFFIYLLCVHERCNIRNNILW